MTDEPLYTPEQAEYLTRLINSGNPRIAKALARQYLRENQKKKEQKDK